MAVLHTVANNESQVTTESQFHKLLQDFKKQETRERVQTIECSDLIHKAHHKVVGQGQSATIAADEVVELHFVAFVKSERNQHLYELDGRRKGPIDHGRLSADEDLLSSKALSVVQQFVARASDTGDLNFSLCALGPA